MHAENENRDNDSHSRREVELLLPSFGAGKGAALSRSSFTLLRPDGARCRAGEPLAFCHVRPAAHAGKIFEAWPIRDELFDFYAVVLAPASGVVRWEPSVSRGGWMDVLPPANPLEWEAHRLLGRIDQVETPEGSSVRAADECLLFGAGRRAAPWADSRGTLFSGWYDELRAWHAGGVRSSIVVAATCIFRPMLLGPDRSFAEVMGALSQCHLLYLPETILLPSAIVLLEEILRTESVAADVARELEEGLKRCSGPACGQSASLIGFLLSRSGKPSPLTTGRPVLGAGGVTQTGAPAVAVLSADSEDGLRYRNREIGFHLCFPAHLRPWLGDGLSKLLSQRFVAVENFSLDALGAQYRMLGSTLREAGTKLVVANSIVLEHGSPLLRPSSLPSLSRSRSHLTRARNGLLRELEQEGVLTLLDLDAVAARVGTNHIPDGGHGDGSFEAEARKELLAVLHHALT